MEARKVAKSGTCENFWAEKLYLIEDFTRLQLSASPDC